MKIIVRPFFLCSFVFLHCTCGRAPKNTSSGEIRIDRTVYQHQLEGFWLGQCIANWTGLITEMDKIGNVGEIKTGDFYTRDKWGGPDQPNIWSGDSISKISPVINFAASLISLFYGEGDLKQTIKIGTL